MNLGKCILVGGPGKGSYVNALLDGSRPTSVPVNGVHVDPLVFPTNKGLVTVQCVWSPDGQDLADNMYIGAQSAIILVDASSRGEATLWADKIQRLCGNIPCSVADNVDSDNSAVA